MDPDIIVGLTQIQLSGPDIGGGDDDNEIANGRNEPPNVPLPSVARATSHR